MTKQIISKDKLLESGLQYGHQTKSWNPAMKPFIAMAKRNIHLINLDKTTQSLENSYNIVKKISERKGTFLFVGTTKQSSKTVRENAERVGAFYIDHRWLGGILTNFRTIQNSVNKLRKLERLEKEGFEGYTKKEAILMKKQLDKLSKALGGIKYMRRVPQAIFVTSIRNEDIAIKEAKKMNIPVFGIADTNVDPYTVNFPIFGNDDANKSTALVTTIIADAIAAAKGEKQLAAYVEDDKIEIMGIIPMEERPQKPRREFKPRTDRPARTEKPVVKEETKPVKEEVKVEAPKKEAKPTKSEEDKKEEKRQAMLDKLSKGEDLSKLSLTDLYGVGSKTSEWLTNNKIDTVEKVSQLDVSSITEDQLSTVRFVGAVSVEAKREKIKVFIEEAKFIVSKA